jgi:hypothetical protein
LNFDTLYLELVDSSGMIRSLLAGIAPDDARLKPNPDSWSMQETLCHLYDEEREDFRPRLDFILSQRGGKWPPIDPQGWVASRKYNAQGWGEVKEKFFAERSRSLDWLKGLGAAAWDLSYAADFGTITAGDMFVSWVAHDNLAIRQLVELRRARLEALAKPHTIAYAGDW